MKTPKKIGKQEKPDVLVFRTGLTVFAVEPISSAAVAWVAEHVSTEPWQWIGGAFSVEHRYIASLVTGMRTDGLVVF